VDRPATSWDLDARCSLPPDAADPVQAWREANEMPDPELMCEALAGHRARAALVAPRLP
jgi:hypothetical protein